jgi:serine/threonine protein kinase
VPKFKPENRLGRYEIVRFIGAGGMGEVYEARHVDLKKRVAIKCLIENVDGFAEIRRRFLQEGEAASRIHHPNVVAIFDVAAEGELVYMVMEFLEGIDLQQRLTGFGPMAGAELVQLMLPVCAAVAAAHDAGVIHRDLKPANIFLARNPLGGPNVPKVLDFGISKLTRDPNNVVTVGTRVLGTPEFLSPEQALGRGGIDAKVDQYALGIMMYQCLSNRLPYTGRSLYLLMNAIVQGAAMPIDRVVPGLDAALGSIIMRAMHVDRSQRFRSVRHLGAALLGLARGQAEDTWAASFDVSLVAPEVGAEESPSSNAAASFARALDEANIPARTVDQVLPSSASSLERPLSRRRGTWFVAGSGAIVLVSGLFFAVTSAQKTGAPAVEHSSPSTVVIDQDASTVKLEISVGTESVAADAGFFDGSLSDLGASGASAVVRTSGLVDAGARATSHHSSPVSNGGAKVAMSPDAAASMPVSASGPNEAPILR